MQPRFTSLGSSCMHPDPVCSRQTADPRLDTVVHDAKQTASGAQQRKRASFRLVGNRARRSKVSRKSRTSSRNSVYSPTIPNCNSLCGGGRTRRLVQPASKRLPGSPVTPVNNEANLFHIFGISSSTNKSFVLNPETGDISYPAGSSIVTYNERRREQTFLINDSRKSITCLAYTADGHHIASGESGHNPKVRIWDVSDRCQIAEFSGHRFAIECVCFSPNLRYVVSIGSIHDTSVNLWNWKAKVRVATNNICCSILGLAFSEDGSTFVTVGNKHVKFWYINAATSNATAPLRGRSGILAEKKNHVYCDVAYGKGDSSSKTFVITKSSLLCEFNEQRLLERWLDLKTEKATSLAVGEVTIAVGCGSGVIQLFNLDLKFLLSLPVPHRVGIDPAFPEKVLEGSLIKYPDVVALVLDEERNKIFSAYNDHSFYAWNVEELHDIQYSQRFMYHSSCMWTVTAIPNKIGLESKGSSIFVTGSSDGSCRAWKVEDKMTALADISTTVSQSLLRVIVLENDISNLCESDEKATVLESSGSLSKLGSGGNIVQSSSYCGNINDRVCGGGDGGGGGHSPPQACSASNFSLGVRSLCVDPIAQSLAVGDRSGNIRIFNLPGLEQMMVLEAHDTDVLSLFYSDWQIDDLNTLPALLASSGRDRLIHLFDCQNAYNLVYSIDDHSAAISSVVLSRNGLLLSCGADKTIIVRSIQMCPNEKLKIYRQHQIVERQSILDMLVDNNRSIIVSACQDRSIRLYNMSDGKRLSSFRGSLADDGTLVRIALDRTGTYIAVSCSNKTVYIWSLDNTECMATLPGHAEVVTDLCFSVDGRYLLTAGADSCGFVWQLSSVLVNTMKRKCRALIAKANASISALSTSFIPDLINSTSPRINTQLQQEDVPVTMNNNNFGRADVSPPPSITRRSMWCIAERDVSIRASPTSSSFTADNESLNRTYNISRRTHSSTMPHEITERSAVADKQEASDEEFDEEDDDELMLDLTEHEAVKQAGNYPNNDPDLFQLMDSDSNVVNVTSESNQQHLMDDVTSVQQLVTTMEDCFDKLHVIQATNTDPAVISVIQQALKEQLKRLTKERVTTNFKRDQNVLKIEQCLAKLKFSSPELYKTATFMLGTIVQSLGDLLDGQQEQQSKVENTHLI